MIKEKKDKDNLKCLLGEDIKVLTTITGILFMIFIILGSILVSLDKKSWNNGQCQCGGSYEFQEINVHNIGNGFVYKCNTCGRIVEFLSRYDK